MVDARSTIHERKQLNLEIEDAFISTAHACAVIHQMLHSGRDGDLLGVYSKFYASFDLLTILTSDLAALKNNQDASKKAVEWLQHQINTENDKVIIDRCRTGYEAFMEYKKVLTAQGVIALPNK